MLTLRACRLWGGGRHSQRCTRRIFPFIGHTGITDSAGIICDFQGPYFVGTEGSMAFGNPTRYIQVRSNHLQRTRTQVERRQMYLLFRMQLDPAKVKNIPAGMTAVEAWDAAVDEANRTYCKRMHNLFCDNCHSHVCRALQTMEYSVGVLVVASFPLSHWYTRPRIYTDIVEPPRST